MLVAFTVFKFESESLDEGEVVTILADGESVTLEEFKRIALEAIPADLNLKVFRRWANWLYAPVDTLTCIRVSAIPLGDCSEMTDEQFEKPVSELFDALVSRA